MTKLVRQSNIKTPYKDDHDCAEPLNAFVIDNSERIGILVRITTNQSIRCCWLKNDYQELQQLPLDLIGILIDYYQEEYVHLIGNHQGIIG